MEFEVGDEQLGAAKRAVLWRALDESEDLTGNAEGLANRVARRVGCVAGHVRDNDGREALAGRARTREVVLLPLAGHRRLEDIAEVVCG